MNKPAYIFRLFLLCLPLFLAMPLTTGCAEGCAGDGDGDGDAGSPDSSTVVFSIV